MKKRLMKANEYKGRITALVMAAALVVTGAAATLFSEEKTEINDEDISVYNYEMEALMSDMKDGLDEDITYVDSEGYNKSCEYGSKIFR